MGGIVLSNRRAFVAIVAIGFFLRLGWWAYARPAPVSDFEYYRRMGLRVLTHSQFGYPTPSAMRVPGHPALMAVLQSISQSIDWLSIAMVTLSALLVPLVYWLTVGLTEKRVTALLAAALAAVNPTFVFLAPVLASEHLYAVLLFAGFVCLVPADQSPVTRRRAAAAGLLLGMATLTRVDALFYAPLAAGLAAWRSGRLRAGSRMAAVVFAGAALVIAPWVLRNRIVIGPGIGISSLGGVTFYYGHNDRSIGYHDLRGTPLEGLSEGERQRRGYELGMEYIRKAGAARLFGDVARATYVLYWSMQAASLHWSTRAVGRTPDEPGEHPIRGIQWLRAYEEYGYHALVIMALVSVLVVRAYPLRFWFVTAGSVTLTWLGDAVVMNAATRHRYAIEAVFCMMAAALLSELARPRPRTSS